MVNTGDGRVRAMMMVGKGEDAGRGWVMVS